MLQTIKSLFGRSANATTPKAAHDLMRQGMRMIDVRDPAEVAEVRVPGAVNVPLGEIQQLGVKALARHGIKLREDESVLVMCRSGARSGMACSHLQESLGERAINVTGGIMGWAAAGLPTTR